MSWSVGVIKWPSANPFWQVNGFSQSRAAGQVPWDGTTEVDGTGGLVSGESLGSTVTAAFLTAGHTYRVTAHLVITASDPGTWELHNDQNVSPFTPSVLDSTAMVVGTYDLTGDIAAADERYVWLDSDADFTWTSASYLRVEVI